MTTTPAALAPDRGAPSGGRLQLALNVDDLDAAIDFYTRMFGVGPVKVKPGYANFAIADPPLKLVLFSDAGEPGTINHLGVEVASAEEVEAAEQRLRAAGLETTDAHETTCCYAAKTETWLEAPDGQRWEWYVKHGDLDGFASDDTADPSSVAVTESRPAVPVVCDLTDAPDTTEERIAEYRHLFAAHLADQSYVDGVVRFRFRADDGVETWVRDLMAREQRCCAFFAFTVHADDGEVIWDATVGDDDAARMMLDEWARLPETVAGGTDAVQDRWTEGGLEFVGTDRPDPV